MSKTTTEARDQLVVDMKAVIADAEELLKATTGATGERISAARARAEETLKAAREKLAGLDDAVIGQAKEAAKAADEYVMVVFRLWQPWHAGAHISEEQIAEEIKALVEPQSWLGEEPFIRVLPSRLIIRQRPSVHLKIYTLLRDLGVLRPREDEDTTDGIGLGGLGGGGLGGSFGAGGFGALPSGGQ